MQSKPNKLPVLTFASGLLLAVMLGLSGCANTSGNNGRVSPLAAQFFTAAAVAKAVDGNPELRANLKAIQPIVCAVTTRQTLTPEDILAAVETVSDANSADAYATVNVIMAIYLTAMGDPGATNAPDFHPYAKAVWCDGFKAGLASPRALQRGAQTRGITSPVVGQWPMLKR